LVTKIAFASDKSQYRPNETVPIQITLTNQTGKPLNLGLVGLLLESGHFKIGAYDLTLAVNQTFQRQLNLFFDETGSYQIRLATCSSPRATCVGPEGSWERHQPTLTVVIQ
jgi:hypothetical protein